MRGAEADTDGPPDKAGPRERAGVNPTTLILPLRHVARVPTRGLSADSHWRIALLFGAASTLLVLRACGYAAAVPGTYAAYFLAHIVLPGFVALQWLDSRPVGPGRLLALGLPAGFALEALQFLALAAIGAKGWHAWSPVAWLALLLWRMRGGQVWRMRLSAHHAGVAAFLAAIFSGVLALAAGQMFSESPLAQGLPARAIFHDWVYLISRAGVIKNHWPLEDPSLAGTPLQYHYFMMVHAAAASWTTGLEISTVLLRLVYPPLALALLAQVFLLGRAVCRSPWGGVAACVLFFVTSELSFSTSYGESHYLGVFSRWLFVSPTFFLGMVFAGALLLVLREVLGRRAHSWRGIAFVLLLGVGGTGAKGTLVPVIVATLVLLALGGLRRPGLLAYRAGLAAVVLLVAFAVVYLPTMLAWRSGGARLNPFHIFEMTGFWREWLEVCEAGLRSILPPAAARAAAEALCGIVIFAGTAGVRLLALPYLAWSDARRRDHGLARLLGAFLAAAVGMGLLLELNSFGEIYVLLMMRLPMAVLAAGFMVEVTRRVRDRRALAGSGPAFRSPAWPAAAAGIIAASLLLQISVWTIRNAPLFAGWLRSPAETRIDADTRDLAEAMLWIRHHTERDAVLVANAWTPENTRRDHWGALDRTLLGVHFYYSALSERRLWLEGHHYVLNGPLLARRAAQASDFFYRGAALTREQVSNASVYLVVDRSLRDDAARQLTTDTLRFSNRRIDVHAMPSAPSPRGAESAALQQD